MMYFKDNDNTNIDNEFGNKNNLLYIKELFFKYKLFIMFLILVLFGIVICFLFLNKKSINYLVLNGEEIITIYEDSDYIEPGYSAYNSKDEDLSYEVNIVSNLNTKEIGEYEISYTLGDITKIRRVNVIQKPNSYTYIFLTPVNNSVNVYLGVGEEYIEPGYQVFTNTGEELVDEVKITGSVDTNKKGTYELVYSIIDSSGVTITKSRIITVMDTEINLSLSTSEWTNSDVTINVNIVDEYFDYMIAPTGTKVYERTYSYKVNENGKWTFIVFNKKGRSKEESITVSNIDKIVPTGSCSGSYKDGVSTIYVNAGDNIGIKKYEMNGKNYSNNKITVNSELEKVNIKIYDKAGNTNTISCSLKDENPKTYYKREFSVKYYESKSGKGLAYWLYIPEGATDNMPLIIYLHGSGGKGNDYENNTRLAIQNGPGSDVYHKRKEYNAIMIMPQVRSNSYLNMDEMMELIDYVAETYKVNKNKISLSGMSEGANQISNKIGNYANYFSSIVLLGNYVSNPDKFVSVPVITMCGELDSSRNSSMKNFVNKINELGGNAKHYTIEGLEHNIVSSSYSVFRDEKYDLVNWMISQTKK